MSRVYKEWKNGESPLWLLHLSRSVVGEVDTRKTQFPEHVAYITQFTSGHVQDFNSPKFMEHIDAKHRAFFEILKKEAAAYYSAFHTQEKENVYAQELIAQVQKAYGAPAVNKFIYNQDTMGNSIGNMVVAIAINAVREMALVDYLHAHGDLTDKEKQAALDDINKRMDRAGLNGIDRLLESRPELEKFIENDVRVIDVSHIPGAKFNEMTRAACYRQKIEDSKDLTADLKTTIREQIIGKEFPGIEEEKNHYLLVHVKDIPPLEPEKRKKYAKFAVMPGHGTAADHKQKGKLADKMDADRLKGDNSSFKDAMLTVLYDGIAVNHPDRDKYAAALRNKMNGIVEPDVIDAPSNPKLSGKSQPLLGGDTESEPGFHVKRLTSGHDASEDASSQKKKDGGAGGLGSESSMGAKIATIGGTAAVGLLLAAGRDKEKNGKEGDDKEKNKGHALRFAALATAAAVAVGGVIMWTKKPEFLYKPMRDMFNSLGFGRA